MNDAEHTRFEKIRVASDFALRWFEIHADQRLKMMNFFLIIVGFCLAGYFAGLERNNSLASSVVAGVLVFICFCFWRLDQRTAQLLKLGENFLKRSLPLIEKQIGIDEFDILNKAEDKEGKWSYRKTFNFLFGIFALLGSAGIFYPWVTK